MDTISNQILGFLLKLIPAPFKKGKVTVNPNEGVEKVQELTAAQINQELQELDKEELTSSEDQREDMLLGERARRTRLSSKEAKEKATKWKEYTINFTEGVAKTPNPFQESQWVRLKTSTLLGIPDGSEGVILDVFPPHLDENGVVRYSYFLEVHAKDPETSRIIGSAAWTVDDDQLEAL